MKLTKYSLIALAFGQMAFAQNQKYTMAEAVNGLRSNLAIKNLSQVSWLKGSNSYIQFQNNAYVATDAKTAKVDTLLSLHQLNHHNKLALKRLPVVKFNNANSGFYKQDSIYFQLKKEGKNWSTKQWFYLPSKAENIALINNQDAAVFTIANNLYYKKGQQQIAITNDKDVNIVNGQAVHRNEFGINGGIFLAPNQQSVAFYRMDQTMVSDYPIIDWSVTPAKNENIKYPMAGQTSHQVSLGVYNFSTQKTTFLNIEGPKDQYLTAITWSPDSKFIFVGVLNREQNHLRVNQYDAQSGSFIKTLFEEKSDKYVEPQNPLTFLPNSNKDFIWQSQRDGYNHLYVYNLDKGFVKQITNGEWLVSSILGFNEKSKEVIISATKETPLEKHLYKVNYNNGAIQRLDKEAGVHNGILSADGTMLVDTFSNATTPRKVNIINTQNLSSKTILTAEDALKKFDRPEVKNVSLKADDGTDLYGKIILPTNFDSTKKYPVIVYLYNGPHLQLITNGYPASGNLWYEYMAQNGYIVFTMDGRGSSNRGLKFEQAVHNQMGTLELEDQMKGVEYLKSLPYVNADKMGIHGWSYGGFMTTSFMLKKPDVFKVGVAGGPVIDWNMYEIMYTERYMSSPQNNPEGYANANLLDKVGNLKGKLLMIHGAQDDVVVLQHSVNFLKSAVDKNVQLDYFIYPGHAHNVGGKDRVHLMQKVTDYFDQHLKN